MKIFAKTLLASGALFSSAALAMTAQLPLDLPQQAEPEIVVYGYPDDGEELSNFVSAIGAETNDDQLSRWRGRVCPTVVGMEPEFNHYVGQTIRSVADIAGIRTANEGCDHNILVVMTDTPEAFLEDLRTGRRDLFGNLTARERERLINGGDAVQLWSRIETRGARGDLMQSGEVSYNIRQEGSDALAWRSVRGATPSRITRATRADLNFRAIVIDLNQLDGQNMQQLSAYAAMLALGEFDVSQPIEPARTILNLFHDPSSAPQDITDWDIAYLRALYSTNAGRSAHHQRNAMIRHARRSLEESGGE